MLIFSLNKKGSSGAKPLNELLVTFVSSQKSLGPQAETFSHFEIRTASFPKTTTKFPSPLFTPPDSVVYYSLN